MSVMTEEVDEDGSFGSLCTTSQSIVPIKAIVVANVAKHRSRTGMKDSRRRGRHAVCWHEDFIARLDADRDECRVERRRGRVEYAGVLCPVVRFQFSLQALTLRPTNWRRHPIPRDQRFQAALSTSSAASAIRTASIPSSPEHSGRSRPSMDSMRLSYMSRI